MQKLAAWKDSEDRKPLILWGARQVGKTWLLKEFGSTYFENVLYISFYNNHRTAAVFEQDYDTERIIQTLALQHHTAIEPQKTLMTRKVS